MQRVSLILLVVGSFLNCAGWASDKSTSSLRDSAHNEQPSNSFPAYLLGPDDQLVSRGINLDEIGEKPVAIGKDGYISLPLLGQLNVAGWTVTQLETELRKQLAKYVHDPQLSVIVTEYRS